LDFICPNETELLRLVPDYDVLKDGTDRLREELLDKHAKLNAVISLGEFGSIFVNEEMEVYMPPVSEFNP